MAHRRRLLALLHVPTPLLSSFPVTLCDRPFGRSQVDFPPWHYSTRAYITSFSILRTRNPDNSMRRIDLPWPIHASWPHSRRCNKHFPPSNHSRISPTRMYHRFDKYGYFNHQWHSPWLQTCHGTCIEHKWGVTCVQCKFLRHSGKPCRVENMPKRHSLLFGP